MSPPAYAEQTNRFVPKCAARLFESSPGLDKGFNPRDAGTGYAPIGLVLPGHPVPAVFLDEIGSVVALRSLEFLDLRCVVRAFHELGDADRCLVCHDRLLGHLCGRAGGRPASPSEADRHGDTCSQSNPPNSIRELRI